jgi:hypothetical protein
VAHHLWWVSKFNRSLSEEKYIRAQSPLAKGKGLKARPDYRAEKSWETGIRRPAVSATS